MGQFSKIAAATVLAGSLFAASDATAAINVNWANWTAQPSATHADGSITTGTGSVDVDYDGAINFTQLNNTGTDFWIDSGYTQSAVNRPTGTDLISLNIGGSKTITFSKAVVNPYLAFTSWNGNTVNFSAPFSIISQGCGYWGCGAFTPNGTSDGFFGTNEVHGVLKFTGTFTSLSFTDSGEAWHGFTVGISDIAPTGGVPEPATWAMLIMGFGGIGAAMRRRRTLAVA